MNNNEMVYENLMELLTLNGYENFGFEFIEQMVFHYLYDESKSWIVVNIFESELLRKKIVEDDKPKFNALLIEALDKIKNKLRLSYGEELENENFL